MRYSKKRKVIRGRSRKEKSVSEYIENGGRSQDDIAEGAG
jgi:hypothetical protein